MFHIELIELVLRRKKEKLNDLKTNQPTNTTDIDVINKEINYLNSIVVRYKIAKLLKLDSNKDYIENNFFGIEEENVDDFHLSTVERDEYNNLVSQLPPEQLAKYKIRRQLSEIVKDNNTDNIEKVDPSLVKYNLSSEKIKEFNDLVQQLQSMADDTTKVVDINAVELLKDEFDKLNVDDTNLYNQIKNNHLDTLDTIIKCVDKEKIGSVFSDVSNYEFASDLSKKYSDIPIKMNLNSVEKLLDYLNQNDLGEDEYNDKLGLLVRNINELAKDDSNKVKLVDMINNTSFRKFGFRSDLNSRIHLDDVHLALQDSDLAFAVAFLDVYYDSLDEAEREKCYGLIKDKVNLDSNNLERVDELNRVLLRVKNNDFNRRLHVDFSDRDVIKLNSQHFNSYDSLVNQETSKLEAKKSKYARNKNKYGFLSSYYDVKIREIEKSIENLSSLENDYSNNVLISSLDSGYNKKTDKIIQLRKEVEELKRLRENVKNGLYLKIIDKRINRRNKKIDKLKHSRVKIVGIQKKIMIPKLLLSSTNGMVNRHFQSKVEVFDSYANDLRNMADAERNMNSMFSGLKAAFYDLKANKYQNKSEFNQKICSMLGNSKINVKGSNQCKINKNTLNTIRKMQQNSNAVQMTA